MPQPASHRNSRCAAPEPRNCFPDPPAACEAMSGHLPGTIKREPDFIMSMPRILTALMASVLVSGGAHLAQAQSAAPKAAKSAAKPAPSKPEAAKPETKPAAAVAGNTDPTLIGQFGTRLAYTATPKGKKVCFALAKPASSQTSPPHHPPDPTFPFCPT